MKKHIKNILLTLIVLFTLLGIGGTVAFASGYIQWGGSDDYHEVLNNLKLIKDSGNKLKGDLNNANHSNEELKVIIQQKEVIIQQKEHEISNLEKEIDDIKDSNDSKIKQAEKDMEHVKEESEKVLQEISK